jgi:HTH-like domain
LRAELRRIARTHPRWGWRMAYRLLRRDTTKAWTGVNHKRVQRLWREESLRRPVRTRKRRRRDGDRKELLRAQRPNQVWALDFQFDETDRPAAQVAARAGRAHPRGPGDAGRADLHLRPGRGGVGGGNCPGRCDPTVPHSP